MIKAIKKSIWQIFKSIDSVLKFPNLKSGEIGIQLGFDMDAPITSDLFSMHRRVSPNGLVIGIDPDLSNLSKANEIIEKQNLNIELIHKAIFSLKGEVEMAFGEKPGWNQLKNIPLDSTVKYNDKSAIVPMDTLDNILAENDINPKKVAHVNITINGSEYYALQGMKNLLLKAKNINLTIVAGRYDESGYIDGVEDYKMITELLEKYGFNIRFKRINELFWWGFITKLCLNQTWVYGKKNYGIIMASKGKKKKLKWYQSFS